jgi:hypothetical protein
MKTNLTPLLISLFGKPTRPLGPFGKIGLSMCGICFMTLVGTATYHCLIHEWWEKPTDTETAWMIGSFMGMFFSAALTTLEPSRRPDRPKGLLLPPRPTAGIPRVVWNLCGKCFVAVYLLLIASTAHDLVVIGIASGPSEVTAIIMMIAVAAMFICGIVMAVASKMGGATQPKQRQ